MPKKPQNPNVGKTCQCPLCKVLFVSDGFYESIGLKKLGLFCQHCLREIRSEINWQQGSES